MGFQPNQLLMISHKSYVKTVGLDGSSYRSPILIELESQKSVVLSDLVIVHYSTENMYFGLLPKSLLYCGHSSHPLKQVGFLTAQR